MLGFIGGVVYVVSKLKPGTDADAPFADGDDGGYDEYDVADRYPDVPEHVPVDEPPLAIGKAPDGWVTVRDSVPGAEAAVLQGLLRSHGIDSVLEPWSTMGRGARDAYGGYANRYSLAVAPEDAAEVEELLS